MEASLSPEQVLHRIKSLNQTGQMLSKKSVKKSDPELMRNALYYYPSWDNALRAAEIDL